MPKPLLDHAVTLKGHAQRTRMWPIHAEAIEAAAGTRLSNEEESALAKLNGGVGQA